MSLNNIKNQVNLKKLKDNQGAVFTEKDDKKLIDHLTTAKALYFGIDATGPYLHLGHLATMFSAMKLARAFDLEIFVVVGGFTALIGDPSFALRDTTTYIDGTTANSKRIETFLKKFGFSKVLNNFEWWENDIPITSFFEYCKYVNVKDMLSRDSTKNRMESGYGMSCAEFMYQMLQAVDFQYLSKKYGVTIQVGGSDQWGNIVTGIDLSKQYISKLYPYNDSKRLVGVTFPLLLNSNGEKFGKTSDGENIWISGPKAKPYQIYQYILNLPDSMIDTLLNLLTIHEIDRDTQSKDPRFFQKEVAKQVVQFLFDDKILDEVIKISDLLFSDKKYHLTMNQVLMLPDDLIFKCAIDDIGKIKLSHFLKLLFSSFNNMKQNMKAGAIYINDTRVTSDILITSNLFNDGVMKIALGKKSKYFIVTVADK